MVVVQAAPPVGSPPPHGGPTSHVAHLVATASLATYVGALNLLVILPGLAVYRLVWISAWDVVGLLLVATLAALTIIPLPWTDTTAMAAYLRMTRLRAATYFPVKVVVEDEESLKAGGRPLLLALEPHSSLPLAIPMVFATASPLLPKALKGAEVHGLASTVCFWVPFIRQLWWSLGLRPASRSYIVKLLSQGKSVVLCPGGVQECLYMQHGSETLFLRKRHGFVRLAMTTGARLVPVFVFGQTRCYNWWRPGPAGLVQWVSRRIGAVPMAIWGRWGTPLPVRHPMTVIIGRPVELPDTPDPTREQVDAGLQAFIREMEALAARHKAAVGCPDLTVRVL